MTRDDERLGRIEVPGVKAGQRYGFRAEGNGRPTRGPVLRSVQTAARSLVDRDRPAVRL